MGLDLFRLLVFVTVVDRAGYSAAGKHLHLSQATVSFHVQALERLFNTKLLVYEARTVHLTPAGDEVFRAARLMLGEGDRLVESVRDVRLGYSGHLAVGASIAFEQPFFFRQVVGPFCRSHPRTRVSLRFGHSLAHAEAVHSRELDLAYVIGWQIPAGVNYEVLHSAQFTFLVSVDHPLAGKGQVTIDDIADAGLITAPLDSVEWTYYRRVLADCGLQDVRPKIQVDGIQARILAAEASLGVLGVFWPPYARARAPGALVALPVSAPLATVEMGLVTRHNGESSVAVKEFGDLLRAITAHTSPA